MATSLQSPGTSLARAFTAHGTATSFTAPAAALAKPSGTGVIDMVPAPPAWVRVVPFGTGAADSQYDMRVTGWSLAGGTGGVGSLWVPVILCQFTVTLSAAVGVATSTLVLDTDRFADTVSDPAANLGSKGVDCQPHSPQNNTPAHYLIDPLGSTVISIDVNVTAGATGANALVGAA